MSSIPQLLPLPIFQGHMSLKDDIKLGWRPTQPLNNEVQANFRIEEFELTYKERQEGLMVYKYPKIKNSKQLIDMHLNVKPFSTKFNYKPLPPQNGASFSMQQLEFSGEFESGNIDKVIRVGDREYNIYMRPDSNTKGCFQWFNFVVKNVTKIKGVQFNIMNFKKKSVLHQTVMRIRVSNQRDYLNLLSNGEYHKNKHPWNEGGYDIRFNRNDLYKYNYYDFYQYKRSFYTLSFRFDFDFQLNITQFSLGIPYTYSDLQDFLRPIKNQNLEILKIDKLCTQLSGIKVPILTITNPKIPDNQKKIVVINARTHPGDHQSSFVMEGVVNYLIGNVGFDEVQQEQIEELRSKFIFKIIPMINCEGVIIDNKKVKPFLFLNMKTHMHKKNFFLYSNFFSLHDKNYQKMRALPQILHNISSIENDNQFRYHSCKFKDPVNRMGCPRIVMFKEFGFPFSFDFISSMFGWRGNKRENKPFGIQDLIKMGEVLMRGVYELSSIENQVRKKKGTLYEQLQSRIMLRDEKRVKVTREIIKEIEDFDDGYDDDDSDQLDSTILINNGNKKIKNDNRLISKHKLKRMIQKHNKSGIIVDPEPLIIIKDEDNNKILPKQRRLKTIREKIKKKSLNISQVVEKNETRNLVPILDKSANASIHHIQEKVTHQQKIEDIKEELQNFENQSSDQSFKIDELDGIQLLKLKRILIQKGISNCPEKIIVLQFIDSQIKKLRKQYQQSMNTGQNSPDPGGKDKTHSHSKTTQRQRHYHQFCKYREDEIATKLEVPAYFSPQIKIVEKLQRKLVISKPAAFSLSPSKILGSFNHQTNFSIDLKKASGPVSQSLVFQYPRESQTPQIPTAKFIEDQNSQDQIDIKPENITPVIQDQLDPRYLLDYNQVKINQASQISIDYDEFNNQQYSIFQDSLKSPQKPLEFPFNAPKQKDLLLKTSIQESLKLQDTIAKIQAKNMIINKMRSSNSPSLGNSRHSLENSLNVTKIKAPQNKQKQDNQKFRIKQINLISKSNQREQYQFRNLNAFDNNTQSLKLTSIRNQPENPKFEKNYYKGYSSNNQFEQYEQDRNQKISNLQDNIIRQQIMNSQALIGKQQIGLQNQKQFGKDIRQSFQGKLAFDYKDAETINTQLQSDKKKDKNKSKLLDKLIRNYEKRSHSQQQLIQSEPTIAMFPSINFIPPSTKSSTGSLINLQNSKNSSVEKRLLGLNKKLAKRLLPPTAPQKARLIPIQNQTTKQLSRYVSYEGFHSKQDTSRSKSIEKSILQENQENLLPKFIVGNRVKVRLPQSIKTSNKVEKILKEKQNDLDKGIQILNEGEEFIQGEPQTSVDNLNTTSLNEEFNAQLQQRLSELYLSIIDGGLQNLPQPDRPIQNSLSKPRSLNADEKEKPSKSDSGVNNIKIDQENIMKVFINKLNVKEKFDQGRTLQKQGTSFQQYLKKKKDVKILMWFNKQLKFKLPSSHISNSQQDQLK